MGGACGGTGGWTGMYVGLVECTGRYNRRRDVEQLCSAGEVKQVFYEHL